MAIVHSLVCWGGRTGKTVSISASTDIVTLTKHGVRAGQKLWPSGTLPAELNSAIPVYARPTTIDTFTLHSSEAGAIANTGQIVFAGSSTYAAVVLKSDLVASPATALSAYGLSDLSRWGTPELERIYDGVVGWNTAREGAGRTDIEVCEIGEAFTEITTTQTTLTIPSAGNQITSTINGKRTAAFHYGKFPKSTLIAQELANGFVFFTQDAPYALLYLSRYRDSVDGIVIMTTNSAVSRAIDLGVQCKLSSSILYSTQNNSSGAVLRGALSEAVNNVFVGFYRPLDIYSNQAGIRVMNNLVTKCVSPLPTDNATKGFYYNNIVIGNASAQWPAQPTGMEHASNNYGPADNAWNSADGTRYTISTDDFVDWAGNDFRPALSTSPQVDTGLMPYDGLYVDIAGGERPNYNNGGFEAIDGGPYEFDHGFGPHPATSTINLTNIVSGSRVLITRNDTHAVLYNDVPGASLSLSTGYIGAFTVIIRKASDSPYYREFQAGGTTVADQTTTIQALQQLDE